jgi:hypothetical protein
MGHFFPAVIADPAIDPSLSGKAVGQFKYLRHNLLAVMRDDLGEPKDERGPDDPDLRPYPPPSP